MRCLRSTSVADCLVYSSHLLLRTPSIASQRTCGLDHRAFLLSPTEDKGAEVAGVSSWLHSGQFQYCLLQGNSAYYRNNPLLDARTAPQN